MLRSNRDLRYRAIKAPKRSISSGVVAKLVTKRHSVSSSAIRPANDRGVFQG
jgi:hypothetical protein